MGETNSIVWAGDQLTVSRLRGLQSFRCEDHNSFVRLDFLVPIFGWFHVQMAMEHSLHSQYYGTQLGFGLVHAFDLLKCKGLHSPSVQGNFHNHLREALIHVMEAHFRNLWCVVGKVKSIKELRQRSPQELHSLAQRIVGKYTSTDGLLEAAACGQGCDELLCQSIRMARDLLEYVSLDQALASGDVGHLQDMLPHLLFRFAGGGSKNYMTEILELLQGLHREWPEDHSEYVCRYCWLINTTGQPGAFELIDMLQEHNIRDIKYTFASSGPYADWDYIGETSASIPCQRSVKDHVEAGLNHYWRRKSHTSPEEDIARLQASYGASKVHCKVPGRKVESRNAVKDYINLGMERN
ncbi:hypothetical protein BC826DRAFT_1127316 [Russula brevipes]|nr:hypothetical protein BC826DRAFT_1127316 [Russula brevipes]